jgi:hypothetical protein
MGTRGGMVKCRSGSLVLGELRLKKITELLLRYYIQEILARWHKIKTTFG